MSAYESDAEECQTKTLSGSRRRGAPLLDEALPCSEFYPVGIDVERRSMSFVRIARSTYKNSAFLVPRHTDLGRTVYTFNLDDLLLRNMDSPLQGARAHYIFISAFCCSTLLARYLDEMSNCLVLKEPALVAQLGMLRYRKSESEDEDWQGEWKQLASVCLGLMNRAFSPDDIVVVKPSDIGNCIGDTVLQHDPRSRALLLSVTLRTFILSVLKSDSRREWTRARARFWHTTVDDFPAMARIELKGLDDARLSAYLWLMTNAFWQKLRDNTTRDRVLTLDGDLVSNDPEGTLTRVMSFFQIPFAPEDVIRIANCSASSKHSKQPGKQYDAATRNADLRSWEERFGAETDAAIAWSLPLAAELGFSNIDGPVAGMSGETAEPEPQGMREAV